MDKKSSKGIAFSPIVIAMLAVAGNAGAAVHHAPAAQPDTHTATAAQAAAGLDLNGAVVELNAPISDAEFLAGTQCTFYSTGGGGTKCTFYSVTKDTKNVAFEGDVAGFDNV